MENNHLYPPIEPYDTGFLEVSDIHTIYYEQSGNPTGIPIIKCNSGPGGAISFDHRRFFNPAKYRIILFDERGCGESIPMGELQENTTQDLVADMEKIRTHLNIDKWHVCGGSWGSSLALFYSEQFAINVSGLIVWGIYTTDRWMNEWFNAGGQDFIFPEEYEIFKHSMNESDDEKLFDKRVSMIMEGSCEEQAIASQAFNRWEGAGMQIYTEPFQPPQTEQEIFESVTYAKVFTHYEINDMFIPENYILENAYKLKNIPGAIVHGRYDLCCPMKAAWQLHKAWPQAEFTVVQNAAHRTEPPLAKAIIEALDKLVN